jgi:hypothetical protein
MKTTTI